MSKRPLPTPAAAKKAAANKKLLFAVATRENQLSMLTKLKLCLPQIVTNAVNDAVAKMFAEIEAMI